MVLVGRGQGVNTASYKMFIKSQEMVDFFRSHACLSSLFCINYLYSSFKLLDQVFEMWINSVITHLCRIVVGQISYLSQLIRAPTFLFVFIKKKKKINKKGSQFSNIILKVDDNCSCRQGSKFQISSSTTRDFIYLVN